MAQIDGLDVLTVQQILTETGLDMSPWPTIKHFPSWLTLAPHNVISGSKVLKSQTFKSTNHAAQASRMAAQSAGRSESALGAFYRRIRAQHRTPKAITATGHKIARIFYHLLKSKQPYQDLGQAYYEQQYRERVINNLKRRAKELGLELVPSPTANIQVDVSW